MNLDKDQQYLQGLKKGDRQTIENLYVQFSRQIQLLIEKNNGDAEDAKDIFQEGLMAIYDLANKKDFQLTCPFGALLYRICRNKWIDKIREKNKRQEVRLSEDLRSIGEETKDVLTLAEEAQQQSRLQAQRQTAFLQLSDLCQQLLNFVKKGVPAKDIVEQLELNNINTYYRRKNACMGRWKSLVAA